MARHEDRDAAVVVTAPVVDDLGGPPTREHRAGGVDLVDELSGRP
jgi:hypothetical protein